MASLLPRQTILRQIASPKYANVLKPLSQSQLASQSRGRHLHTLPQTLTKPATALNSPTRTFTTSSPFLKKAGKFKGSRKGEEEDEDNASSSSLPADDPNDLSSLESAIQASMEKLKLDLMQLKTGGRFDPERLEKLIVTIDKKAKVSAKLADLADVIPKGGRNISVVVYDEDHVKPIISAIQSSPMSLQPIPNSQNPQQLDMPIPPPTKESRELAAKQAGQMGETASTGVRNARAAMQKKFRAMEVGKTGLPDVLKKAHKAMEKVVEKANGDVKKIVDDAKKAMMA